MRRIAEEENPQEYSGRGRRFGIVVADFHRDIADQLLASAWQALTEAGAQADDIVVVRVPGSFEVPPTARRLAASGVDAVICLGAVIQGETAHFDYVCRAVTDGLARLAYEADIPISFGILTTYTPEQALARTDKGREAAQAALRVLQEWEKLGLRSSRLR